MKSKPDKTKFIQDLKNILEEKYVLSSEANKYGYRKGYRYDMGEAFAVIKPGDL